MNCEAKGLTALDAYEHSEKMFAKFLESFPDEAREIRGVSIHEDGTLHRKRRLGYYFWIDFEDGLQVAYQFSWPLSFVRENSWYCAVFLGIISGRLRDLAPDKFSLWIMNYEDESSTPEKR